jgi:hypothetical protein
MFSIHHILEKEGVLAWIMAGTSELISSDVILHTEQHEMI